MQRGHRLLCELEEFARLKVAFRNGKQDRLTGVFSRETMLTMLYRETDRVQRLRGALCLMLFDIDDFAHWNEELGHQACDGLLREVIVRTGRFCCVPTICWGVMGADEFLVGAAGVRNAANAAYACRTAANRGLRRAVCR